ncbi:MAG: NifB/NifX family molybdenum-iron cluster-binding protein, partial [Bacillota bacterium]|nr:NifB/NifX family molybdenum-iron cluster-binding protein [Bacillota bacterium]
MKIAVTYEEETGEIYQHFGHCHNFKIYHTEGGEITSASVVSSGTYGHGGLATFLQKMGVDTLICGGIGGGAQNALKAAGIKFFGGVKGNADKAVKSLITDS